MTSVPKSYLSILSSSTYVILSHLPLLPGSASFHKIAHSTSLTSMQVLILQAISALHGRLTRGYIA